jgi:riboflavin transporter FmnP
VKSLALETALYVTGYSIGYKIIELINESYDLNFVCSLILEIIITSVVVILLNYFVELLSKQIGGLSYWQDKESARVCMSYPFDL